MVMGMTGVFLCVTLKASGPGIGGDAAVVGIRGVVPCHGVVGDRGHPVADWAEETNGLVVTVRADALRGGDAELAGELVDLAAAAVVSAVSGQVDFVAVPGHRDGRVPVEVVSQRPQAGDEGLTGFGISGESHHGSFPGG